MLISHANVILDANHAAIGDRAISLQQLMPLGATPVQLVHENSRNPVAPFVKFLFKNMVAMQENPTGSTILRVA
ncbi:hypothetical protein [Paraburkholderia sp.]|jgi:hypothetical protein|uniref:hypothetical protein n=1 Tax=Paraburkholderia sp. TaxID=1926495 RepID=UPI002AFF7F1A|nr:hypothetical protein [Paraburkholderia sp.]